MADKPRVKAPKQRASHCRRRAAVAVATLADRRGRRWRRARLRGRRCRARDRRRRRDDRHKRAAARRSRLPAARCRSLRLSRVCTRFGTRAGRRTKWNTDPPTSGPHYGIAAIFGIYDEELELARVVHNLEHGGIFILYGKDVPDSTVEELRAFYDDAQDGDDHGAAQPTRRQVRARRLGRRRRDRQRVPREVHELRRRTRSRRSSARSSSAGPSDSTRASSSPGM